MKASWETGNRARGEKVRGRERRDWVLGKTDAEGRERHRVKRVKEKQRGRECRFVRRQDTGNMRWVVLNGGQWW